MWRGRLFFLCLALALLSGCAPGGPVAEAGADAQLPADKLIAITFDDGPRRNTTERLLDGLQERGASATFFLIGKQIEGNEDLVRRMQAEGHQVGSHTWNHVRLQGVSRETLQREVGRTEETLEALLGGGPYWLRPPYGAVDAADRELLQVPMIKWSIDPRDWEKLNTAQVKAAVLENAAPNQIILLHDIYDTSVDAALEIVDTLQGEGYRFVTVQELLEANGIQPEAGVLYCSGEPNSQYQVDTVQSYLEEMGYTCTQYSFSDDQTLLGAPSGFEVTVRNLKVSAGAGFIVALTGDIMTMPGLPKVPSAEKIDVDNAGVITGLF